MHFYSVQDIAGRVSLSLKSLSLPPVSLACSVNSQQRDVFCDIPSIFLQTSNQTQERAVQLETEIEYESGMFSFLTC